MQEKRAFQSEGVGRYSYNRERRENRWGRGKKASPDEKSSADAKEEPGEKTRHTDIETSGRPVTIRPKKGKEGGGNGRGERERVLAGRKKEGI